MPSISWFGMVLQRAVHAVLYNDEPVQVVRARPVVGVSGLVINNRSRTMNRLESCQAKPHHDVGFIMVVLDVVVEAADPFERGAAKNAVAAAHGVEPVIKPVPAKSWFGLDRFHKAVAIQHTVLELDPAACHGIDQSTHSGGFRVV